MLLVQEYLLNHTFKQLAEEHGVFASFSKSGHKFSLNYDMLLAKEDDLLAQQCRGLILTTGESLLDQASDAMGHSKYDHICPGQTQILAYPMNRFFNYGQGVAAQINWKDPKLMIMEKLDGTLTIVYYDFVIDQWCIATRSAPDADIPLSDLDFTFRGLFEKALYATSNLNFEQFTRDLNKRYTYCFELTSPYNQIVVKYLDCSITLLTIRDIDSCTEELSLPENLLGIPLVKSYSIATIDEVIAWVNSLNPMEHEGVVIKDSSFNRIKIKNADYVAYSKVRDGLSHSDRNCLSLILNEKEDDVIPHLPNEISHKIIQMKQKLQNMILSYDEIYAVIKSISDGISPGDKKTFALNVQRSLIAIKNMNNKNVWSAPFYQIYDKKVHSMSEFLKINGKDGEWSNSFLDKILEIIDI